MEAGLVGIFCMAFLSISVALVVLVVSDSSATEGSNCKLTKDGAEIGNRFLKIGFRKGEKGIYLSEMMYIPSGTSMLQDQQFGDSFWEMEFRSPDSEGFAIGSSDALNCGFDCVDLPDSSGKRLYMTFSGFGGSVDPTLTVIVSIDVANNDPVTEWYIRYRIDGSRLPLWKVSFPRVPNLFGGAELAIPDGWGILRPNIRKGENITYTYPSLSVSSQFVGAGRDGAWLYFSTHDPDRSFKKFIVRKGKEKDDLPIELAIDNYPANMGIAGSHYELPYVAAVGLVENSWYEVAEFHREWLYSLDEFRLRTEDQPEEIPPALMQVDLWLLAGDIDGVVGQAVKFQEFFQVPIAVHWYGWHNNEFDKDLPEYFPPKEGFTEANRKLKSLGFLTMPYINARLWDPNTESWKAMEADLAAAKNEKFERYDEYYAGKGPLTAMCPSTRLWQDTIVGIVDSLINGYGVDGVYLDQIGAAAAELCFDPGHGHSLGGGSLWSHGYSEMLERIREVLGPDNFITTEENADAWMGLIDGYLMVNTAPNVGPLIPLFPAVHSQHSIYFGFMYIMADDMPKSLPFRAKMAYNFVFGGQLGWVNTQILDEKFRPEAEYLRTLAKVRHLSHGFLLFGKMLKPPVISGAEELSISGDEWRSCFAGSVPSVLASAWESGSGGVGIAVTNMADTSRKVKLGLHPEKWGMDPDTDYFVVETGPSGRRIRSGPGPVGVSLEIDLPGRSAFMVEFMGE